jgi:hypothetical protein
LVCPPTSPLAQQLLHLPSLTRRHHHLSYHCRHHLQLSAHENKTNYSVPRIARGIITICQEKKNQERNQYYNSKKEVLISTEMNYVSSRINDVLEMKIGNTLTHVENCEQMQH